ncbi:MAG: hypothetical protein SF123_12260 [Chloroflexota bacterium]|nr:hypothetical protein [Chloroflexota bacterium]
MKSAPAWRQLDAPLQTPELPSLETAAAGEIGHIVGLSTVNPRRKWIIMTY